MPYMLFHFIKVMENEKELPDCCKTTKKANTIWQAIGYGLLAHAGCIAFIIASIVGATAAVTFLKPIMMNRYFFYILIAISFVFATISSVLYLRKNGFLSKAGIKKKKGYLATMYGITLGVNVLLFIVIFPALANAGSITGATVASSQASMTISVDIPCPGHAPLVTNALKALGVDAINFKFPNKFEIGYTPSKVSKQQIMNIDVFDEYPATIIAESNANVVQSAPASSGGGCGCGGSTCGGSGSCCGG